MVLHPAEIQSPSVASVDQSTLGASGSGRLERLADRLALHHKLASQPDHRQSVLAGLPALARLLRASRHHFMQEAEKNQLLSHAAEWLLDNYFVVELTMRQIKQDLPPVYYRRLPKLSDSSSLTGGPRVLAVTRAFLRYEDFHLDIDRFVRFLAAYQRRHVLTMGEIWALPIMLRYVLVSSTAQAAGRIARLYDELAAFEDAVKLDQSVPFEAERVLSDQDIVAASIPSLRLIEAQDWEVFFEQISIVQQILCSDPAGVYENMDFATRNRYRSVVETIARRRNLAETAVAEAAVGLASAAWAAEERTNGDLRHASDAGGAYPGLQLDLSRTCHVGYYLVDTGRSLLEEHLNYQPKMWETLRRWIVRHPTLVYLGSISLLVLFILSGVLLYTLQTGSSALACAIALLLTLIPALTLAVGIVQWMITHILPPHVLPKLDFEKGLPERCRTMVVVPALIAGHGDVDSLFGQLEQHYLRNPDPHITFAVLSDFGDAPSQDMPEDEALLERARQKIEYLNQKYPNAPFFLFHRRRLWNAQEEAWMGWERKRGKLHEFNRLLRGKDGSFGTQIGRLSILPQIRYVITLDADTILPQDGGRMLVGTLAHPLNRAHFDSAANKVTAGYTVLQPRAAVKPVSANRSLFTKVFAGDSGLDLYTLAVSDAYQDLFSSGVYVGKGIYDVDAFERSLEGRVPENALLSHDLFEGIHGRVGLVTDIVVYEDYPPHYLVNLMRSHRWVRGDWQLLPWLLPKTPRRSGWAPNDFAWIDRWKIFDNLRRSVLPPALLLLFLAGWTVLPGSPLFWTTLGLLTPAFSLLASIWSGVASALRGKSRMTWRRLGQPVRNGAVRWLLLIAFLPHESLLTVDAISRTLVRLTVTRRRLLEWTTAARAVRMFESEMTPKLVRSKMLPSIILVVALGILIRIANPDALIVASPFLAAWLFAAEIAYWISRPYQSSITPPSLEQQRTLRGIARRTWLFYEQFVGPEDNWLPPDHFQESPNGVVAHRTSPTNVGMYMLSTLAAHDLGYITTSEYLLRLQFMFDTLVRLERYRGHFFNWIDTRSLRALTPRYVSTVDSGNLAACLLTLKQGCLQLLCQPAMRWESWQGFLDTILLLAGPIDGLGSEPNDDALQLQSYLHDLEQRVLGLRDQPNQWAQFLFGLYRDEQHIPSDLLAQAAESNAPDFDADTLRTCRIYAMRIHHHLTSMQHEVDTMLPWVSQVANPPACLVELQESPQIAEQWLQLAASLPSNPSWEELPDVCRAAGLQFAQLQASIESAAGGFDASVLETARAWCEATTKRIEAASTAAQSLLDNLIALSQRAATACQEMEFGFLYHPQRNVFHIGCNLDTGQLDNSYYDLLASEARIASMIAIAKQDIPLKHWLHLGRPVTQLENGEQALLSWSGTMFEYLMPTLLLRNYPDTLLHSTCHACVSHQIEYGLSKGMPWGISESGFHAFDAALNYQYRAFGVPGLGIKRGLAEDQVVTPYASLLALTLRPQEALENLHTLQELGMLGRYGLYEAVDFTPSRLMLGGRPAIVRSYMAHHQGMILMSAAASLAGNRMVERLHAEPLIQSVELLLQEQVPHLAPIQFPERDEQRLVRSAHYAESVQPWHVPVDTPMPMVHYLANGHYGFLITNSGGGYSRCGDLMLTRWHADTSQDNWGCWLYVQDMLSGDVWSLGRQPIGKRGQHEEVIYHPHMAEFRRRDDDLTVHTEALVAPDEDVEIRRITITNSSDQARRLGISSYAEVALAEPAADRRHPAFTKLFVESEHLADLPALLFRRRPRAATEAPIYLLHMLVLGDAGEHAMWGRHVFETDRAQFLGRNRNPTRPAALQGGYWWARPYSGRTGSTLDPIMAIGQEVDIGPHGTVQLSVITLAAPARQDALSLARRYQRWTAIDRTFVRARAKAEEELRQIGMSGDDFQCALQLISLLLYPHAAKRAPSAVLAANELGQNGLWGFGISGDYPILLLNMADETDGELLQEALLAHKFWSRRGVLADLVILNQQETDYGQSLQIFIHRTIRRLERDTWLGCRGGIFVVAADRLGVRERLLLQTAARVILDGRQGLLAQQLAEIYRQPSALPLFQPTFVPDASAAETAATDRMLRPDDLQYDNGYGGFSADGREYVIWLEPGETTPAPWSNVIAQPDFGFIATESGGGYTWAHNSGENRLTGWHNDPVSDSPSEALYLRDEETGEIWTATQQPAPAQAAYMIRHGAGYTIHEHSSHELAHTLRLFAAPESPVKVIHLRLQNKVSRPRRLTVTYYAGWVLGVDRQATQPYIVPEYDERTGALLARNPYNAQFGGHVAFLAANKLPHGLTTDRAEFLGRLGSLQPPAGLTAIGLTGRVEAGVDPCAVLQLHVDLPASADEGLYFLLGQSDTREDALGLIEAFLDPGRVEAEWNAVHALWDKVLGTVTVRTPDAGFDLLLNRWLLYQTLSCRIWGRSALYQSGGAFGFRDQLQDVMALIHSNPAIARAQILRAARHQFLEGDVLHWWHPPTGRGVRTRISDDLLWLPYVTAHYVAATGDTDILLEKTSFLQAEPLGPTEEERYSEYASTEEKYSLYEHCRRALAKGVTSGSHGIPLIGTGDWNDGMSRVGVEGNGESIWLGWFTFATLSRFAQLCDRIGESAEARKYRAQAGTIREAVETHGWDGMWYRRAYYDDGSPLGSLQNRECQIDSIAQSWAVLSGGADRTRAEQAMHAVQERLVRREDGLILLFSPPFDKTPRDPGYIKGYVPGIRENGGQYTHAALWTIWAMAELGDGDAAGALLRLINPIYKTTTPAAAEKYMVEPYVIAADIYSVAPHNGRGGWTWYTGSSSWMYRLGLEAILGVRRCGTHLHISPCIEHTWREFSLIYRYGTSIVEISVRNPDGVSTGVKEVVLDGEILEDGLVPLRDDGRHHMAIVRMG